MTRKSVPPKYRHQKSRNLAVVRIHGKDHYLGKYGSPESKQLYAQLIAEKWLDVSANIGVRSSTQKHWLVVDELIALYMTKYVHRHYLNRKGKPSERFQHIQVALRLLHELYGRMSVNEFGPKRFKLVRERMIQRGQEEQNGYARSYVNDHMSIIRNLFRWGVEEEQVPIEVHQSLLAVQPLRIGREPRVHNKKKVLPVSEEMVFETLPHLSPQLAAMVQLQLHTAMRPDEVTIMRSCDFGQSREVWIYTPSAHKTEHFDYSRQIFLGPKCQSLLEPWLDRSPMAYLFSPREVSVAARHRHRRLRRDEPENMKYDRCPREHYDDKTYSRAIKRVCDRIGIPRWTANQLRHTAATFIRKTYGLEAAKIILGHQSTATAEIYAEKDLEIAINIMKEIG